MKHLSESEQVAVAMGYGEPEAASHAATCETCQAAVNAWQTVLQSAGAVEVPEPPTPASVWQKLAPQLEQVSTRRELTWQAWPVWTALAAACLALAVFLLVRPHHVPQPVIATNAAVRQPSPVLRFAVTQHLDRTQVLLVELAHADETPGRAVDLSLEKSSARSLLNANRLYHQSAALQGDAMMAHVLSSLEPPLLEIAHSPNQVSAATWNEMQHRIAVSGVLFKVRVLDQTLHAQHGAL